MYESNTSISKQKIGAMDIEVSRMGFGCMGMSEFYGPKGKDEDSGKLLQQAVDMGVNFFDTANMYGCGHNERLVGRAFKNIRSQVIISTKFGVTRDPGNPALFGLNGKPEYVKQACEGSLRRLNTDYIDLYFYHRIDPSVPIEETIGAMSELVKEGKVRAIGLSKAPCDIIRRAHQVHPITALQSEYSLWSREIEADVLPLCQAFQIAFIAYSPLGRGYLTGAIHRRSALPQGDYRLGNPKFSEEEFEKNK